MSNKIQFVGKIGLMKELQRTVAFRAYNSVLPSGNSKSAKESQKKVHSLYFGNKNDEGSMGLAEQLLKGMNAFSPMFDKEEIIGKETITLTLKKTFHSLSEKFIVSTNPKDKGIKMAVLSSKGPTNRVQITSRSIWDFGKRVEKSGKKLHFLMNCSPSTFTCCDRRLDLTSLRITAPALIPHRRRFSAGDPTAVRNPAFTHA